ncbi:dynein regulation protein LC7 [Planomonospora parontospora subsp. parontospora]|uniref:Dynein regulation protein LC7 n=2 Tax=Planomonospora parontospora TaxID=58119 RepID=A0AA37BLA4_9ACTN|nr:roadblock/LC7 domain-containing protein [Planomonospora parontospora]GGK87839.1 dynein regulation protein LC7 [Planomonospora parontospora]GII11490.1 dynein regulation protein LC7 [Planomonospora parontospora subsp. parontospora]
MVQGTGSVTDLAWLLDDLVTRVAEAENGIVFSTDGLLMAASAGLSPADAEHLAAVGSAIQSLGRGVSDRVGGGAVRQTIIEMRSAYLVVSAAGQGACLAVLCTHEADVGLVAYEMAMLVTRVGQYLTSPARTAGAPAEGDAAG